MMKEGLPLPLPKGGVLIILALLLVSCEKLYIPTESSGGTASVIDNSTKYTAYGIIKVVANDNEVGLPINVYAVVNNAAADSTSISAYDDQWSLTLGSGAWTITAMSQWPTWFGSQSINLTEDSETSIVMSPAVSLIDFSLKGVKGETCSVELTGTYKSMKPTGSYSGTKTVTLPLSKNDTAFVGSTYIYPSKGTLGITIIADDTTYYYAYTDGLDAAYKYHFRGTYEDGKSLTGWITIGDWAGEKTVDFNFGSKTGGTISNLTMSAETWEGVLSAYSDNPTMADSIASAYKEGGYTWRIPTKEEAAALRNTYPDATNTSRYLCEGGTYTFSFVAGSSVTKAGSKAEYRLRLVR